MRIETNAITTKFSLLTGFLPALCSTYSVT
jgi:hypothetical protein